MLVWIIQDGEPLPGIDSGTRDWRCGILAKALVAKEHEVLWWASTFDHTAKRHRFSESRTVEIMPRLVIRPLHGPGYQENRSAKRFLHNRALARSFAGEAAEAERPDVILASLPTPELAEQAVKYGQRTGTPVLVDVRDLWPDHYLTLAPKPLRGLLRLGLANEFRRTRWLLKHATGITSISKTFLDWALRLAGTRQRESDGVFLMSYPAPSLPEAEIAVRKQALAAKYGLTEDSLTITFVGSVNSIFDFQTVIDAARVFEPAEKKVRFVFVGNGTNYAPVRAQAHGLKNVVFTGQLDQLSVAAMLGLASVGLAPYAEGQSISGSLPNKAFEYMSVGLPLLSSHQGDLAKLISDAELGLQYQFRNPESLTQQIQWLIDHPAKRIAMGQRSRKLFEERFSPHIVYSRFVAHLEQVANAASLTPPR
jgi:glycosyltransferase involved in cell wall biosynthesis